MTARPQTIFRAAHGTQNPYFLMRRLTVQDDRLSFEARGVIAYLLSKSDNWEINESELRKAGGIGRDKMRRIIGELVELGYMSKEQLHSQADETKGRFLQNVYYLHEEPLTEKPSTGKPSTANPQQHNTESLDNTENDSLPDEKISGEDENLFDFPNATPLQRSKQALGKICFDNPLDKLLPAGTSKRVNTIKRELYEAYPERPKTDFSAELFRYAARCYMADKPPGFNMPQDAVKFLTAMRGYFEIYWTNKLEVVPVSTISEKPVSEAEAAAKRRAAMPKPRGQS